MVQPKQKLTRYYTRERLNVNFFLRIDDSHCDRIPFSLITDQTYIYNPSSSNLFKRLLFFDEICSLFSKLPPLKSAEYYKLLNKCSFFFSLKKNEIICRKKCENIIDLFVFQRVDNSVVKRKKCLVVSNLGEFNTLLGL